MCFPPQIGSLLKESIMDLKVQKNNLDMILVYFKMRLIMIVCALKFW